MKRLILSTIALVVLVVVALTLIPSGHGLASTEVMLRVVRLQLCEIDQQRFVTSLKNLREPVDSEFIERRINKTFASGNESRSKEDKLWVEKNGFKDTWGTRLVFMTSSGSNWSNINPLAKWSNSPIAFWSAGPNKINEWGYGDDLFFPEK